MLSCNDRLLGLNPQEASPECPQERRKRLLENILSNKTQHEMSVVVNNFSI